MTPKPQSVCKHCGKVEVDHFDGHCEYGPHKFEPVAEPAEPSAGVIGERELLEMQLGWAEDELKTALLDQAEAQRKCEEFKRQLNEL